MRIVKHKDGNVHNHEAKNLKVVNVGRRRKSPRVIKKAKLEEVSLMDDGTVEVGLHEVQYGLLPGEAQAIATVCKFGEKYGYGNLIFHLRDAWSAMLQREYDMDPATADMAAGHVCVWCRTDSRTGKKLKKASSQKH